MAPTAVSTVSPFSWTGTTWSGDVLLNGAYQFGSNGTAPYDLYTIALHEAGHVFGLEDTAVGADSAMYQNYIGPRTGLSAQDIAAVLKPVGDEIEHCYMDRTLEVRGAGHLVKIAERFAQHFREEIVVLVAFRMARQSKPWC